MVKVSVRWISYPSIVKSLIVGRFLLCGVLTQSSAGAAGNPRPGWANHLARLELERLDNELQEYLTMSFNGIIVRRSGNIGMRYAITSTIGRDDCSRTRPSHFSIR